MLVLLKCGKMGRRAVTKPETDPQGPQEQQPARSGSEA